MKNVTILLSIFAALSFSVSAQKLQIGIKKRVENCEIKAQKGDLVHIHYTVSVSIIRSDALEQNCQFVGHYVKLTLLTDQFYLNHAGYA